MGNRMGCCKVEAVVSVDSRGQIVLPKDLREKARLKPEDKLAVLACEEDDELCCIVMVKVEKLANTIKETLGPALKEIFE